MNSIKKLVSQTAIYGISSILGRFLNYLLVPLHTAQFVTLQYGIITEMYAYVAFLVVLLTYGMETAFFRFSSNDTFEKKTVYKTAVTSLLLSTTVFIFLMTIFSIPIAEWLKYPNHTEYIIWFAMIVGLDAVSSLPMAWLRSENKPIAFSSINMINIFINIGLNVFFIGYCMPKHGAGETNIIIDSLYNPEIGVGYVFISNLIASIVKFIILTPLILKHGLGIKKNVFYAMLVYGLPLLVAGVAGIINETLDRILLKWRLWDVLGEEQTLTQLGIYGACYKISILITLFIQAFRYAAEPFFFAQAKEKDANSVYSQVMNYFVIVCAFIFLGVMLYLDIIKHFLRREEYWQGLQAVPILLLANVFLGIYFNLSIWYKLSGKTIYGAVFSIVGAVVTIIMNIILIPKIGYMGSAWATLVCYVVMCVCSYVVGQRIYHIYYQVQKVLFYIVLALTLWFTFSTITIKDIFFSHILRIILLSVFLGIVFVLERTNFMKKIQGI